MPTNTAGRSEVICGRAEDWSYGKRTSWFKPTRKLPLIAAATRREIVAAIAAHLIALSRDSTHERKQRPVVLRVAPKLGCSTVFQAPEASARGRLPATSRSAD